MVLSSKWTPLSGVRNNVAAQNNAKQKVYYSITDKVNSGPARSIGGHVTNSHNNDIRNFLCKVASTPRIAAIDIDRQTARCEHLFIRMGREVCITSRTSDVPIENIFVPSILTTLTLFYAALTSSIRNFGQDIKRRLSPIMPLYSIPWPELFYRPERKFYEGFIQSDMSIYSHGYSAERVRKLPRRPYFLRNYTSLLKVFLAMMLIAMLPLAWAQNSQVENVFSTGKVAVRQRATKSVEYKNGLIFMKMGNAIVAPRSRLSKISYIPCDILDTLQEIEKLLGNHNKTCNITRLKRLLV